MNLNEYSWLVLAVLAAGLCVQLWLAWRHIGHVRKHNNQVPEAFSSKISLEAHQKAANYTIAKTHLGVANTLLNAGVLLIWTFAGGLEILDQLWRTAGWDTLYTGTALLLTFMLIGILIDLPLSLYSTFVVEEEYGFNKMTLKIFFTDMVKGIALAGAIGWYCG